MLGVSIGGLSREEAARTLTRELRDEARAPVPVQAGPEARSVRPAAAGLSLDVAATVDAAGARSWNPADLLDALVGGDEVAPVVAVDRAALTAAVDRLADRVDRAPGRGRGAAQGHRGPAGQSRGRPAGAAPRGRRRRSPTATWTPTAPDRSSCPRGSAGRRSGSRPSTGRSPRWPSRPCRRRSH